MQKKIGYDSFSTTLLVSPYQNHEVLKEVGEKIADKYGIEFVYIDFREGFREGQRKARELRFIYAKILWMYFFRRRKIFKTNTKR